jgi:hypothetical protein
MKSKCCDDELIMDVSGALGYISTKYVCRKCKKEYSPNQV